MNSNKLKLRGSIMLLCIMASSLLPLFAVTSGGFAKITHSENRVVVTTQQELLDYLTRNEAYTIYVSGNFTFTEPCQVSSNKALIGTVGGASISGQGFIVENVSNVLIEGINLSGVESEAIIIQKGAKNVWVNHCTFNGNENLCIRIRPGSDLVTISGNRFQNCQQACKIGYGSIPAGFGLGLRVTLHDNYFTGVEEQCIDVQRSPICHVYRSQMYNDCVAVTATMWAKVLVEDCDGICDNSAYVTQVGDLEEGHIKIVDDLYCGYVKEDNTVPTPTYTKEDLMVDDFGIYAYLPEYYSGASSMAAGYNSSADYDGAGVRNLNVGYGMEWVAYHSGRTLRTSTTEEADGSYAFIQGAKVDWSGYSRFDAAGEFVWFRIYNEDWELKMVIGEGDVVKFAPTGQYTPFRFQPVSDNDNLFRIICGLNEKCLEVTDASMETGAVVRLATCKSGKANQMFYESSSRSLSNATGIVEQISDAEISVYPNPANSELNIAVPESMLDKAYSVEIVNAIGQKVFERTEMEGEINTIDIGNLSSGMYWVKLVSGKQIISKKLIKN